jgi:hypothetical protein
MSQKALDPDLAILRGEDLGKQGEFAGQAHVQRALQAFIDGRLRHPLRKHGTLGQLRGELAGPSHELVRLDNFVAQTNPQCLLGFYLTARQTKFLGSRRPNKSSESLRTAAPGDDAEQNLGLAEHSTLTSDAIVTRQCQLATPTECVARHRSDHHTGNSGKRREGSVKDWSDPFRFFTTTKLRYIGTRSEDSVTTSDDNGTRRIPM